MKLGIYLRTQYRFYLKTLYKLKKQLYVILYIVLIPPKVIRMAKLISSPAQIDPSMSLDDYLKTSPKSHMSLDEYEMLSSNERAEYINRKAKQLKVKALKKIDDLLDTTQDASDVKALTSAVLDIDKSEAIRETTSTLTSSIRNFLASSALKDSNRLTAPKDVQDAEIIEKK